MTATKIHSSDYTPMEWNGLSRSERFNVVAQDLKDGERTPILRKDGTISFCKQEDPQFEDGSQTLTMQKVAQLAPSYTGTNANTVREVLEIYNS